MYTKQGYFCPPFHIFQILHIAGPELLSLYPRIYWCFEIFGVFGIFLSGHGKPTWVAEPNLFVWYFEIIIPLVPQISEHKVNFFKVWTINETTKKIYYQKK